MVRPNPSRWSKRITESMLALCGCAIAVYLSLVITGSVTTAWDPVFGAQSDRVLHSSISQAFEQTLGFPDAALGAGAYLIEAVLALSGGSDRWQRRRWLVVLFGLCSLGLGLAGLLLVAMQAFVVHAWCLLCLASAAISIGLCLMACEEVFAALARRSEESAGRVPAG